MVVEESAKGQAEHEEHHDQDGASVKMVLGRRHEGVPEGRVNGLKTGIDLQTKQEDIRQDIKYCQGMDDIMLPVYNPVSYKPGFSGNRGRAELTKSTLQQKFVHCVEMAPIVNTVM